MLSDTAIRNAKPAPARNGAPAKARKLPDQGGLYVYVAPTGTKSWRYDFRLHGKRGTFVAGLYPDVGVSRARELHAEARRQVAAGINPSGQKQRAKREARVRSGNTVDAVAEDWFAGLAPHRSKTWQENARRWIDQRISPALGARPVAEVEPEEVLTLIKSIAQEHPKTAEYVRQTLTRIFQFAIVTSRVKHKHNPARECVGAFIVPPPVHHKPMAFGDVYAFTEAVDAYAGRLHTKLAIRALLLTVARKQEITGARWSELDADSALWRVPAERMKNGLEHLIPLSTQALAILEELRPMSCGSAFVFPNLGNLSKPMSGTTINAAFDRMKIAMVPHGIRATFSTWANESGYEPDHIERQLAHVERNRVRGSYNAAKYLEQRRVLLQAWADFCDLPPNVASLDLYRTKARTA